MEILEVPLKNNISNDWFLDCVNELYKNDTMISFDSIKSQLNLLGINVQSIADKAFYQQGSTEKTIDKMKRVLNFLYKRRNLIAHQYDRSHCNAQIQDISKMLVSDLITEVVLLINAIHNYASEEMLANNEIEEA